MSELTITCKWREDEDGTWWTECNNGFQFTNDGPRENKMNFCCYCGHTLEPIKFVDPDDEYDPAEEARNDYSLQRDDEDLKQRGIG